MEQEMPDSDDASTGFAARLEGVHSVLQRISELETDIRRMQAAQVREVARYIEERQQLDLDLGVPVTVQYRAMVAEIAMAMSVSATTAQSFMSDAHQLVANNPAVLEALANGKLTLSSVRSIAVETALIRR